MIYFQRGGVDEELSVEEIRSAVISALEKLPRGKVLAIPPDYTRFHSKAGKITELVWEYPGDN